LHKSVDKI